MSTDMVDCSILGHLPPEIRLLILIRLPVKTLLILKCVCRYFYRIVSSPYFIKEHIKFSSSEDVSMSNYNLMFQGVGNNRELKLTSVRSLWRESSVNLFNIEYPQSEFQKKVRIVGSCNGLVVIIVNQEHLFLWNPAIRKHKKLPTIVGHKYLGGFLGGLGFDASNDDYKVVALFKHESTNGIYYPYQGSTSTNDYAVYVYSLKRSSWIRISDFTGGKFNEFDKPFAKFASGKLHWTSCNDKIISFDVEREVFGTLEQPTSVKGYLFVALSVLGGSICLCYDNNNHSEMWIMKEYGIKESWTKIFALSHGFNIYCPLALSIMPNGEVLMENDRYCFEFYNPKDDSRRSTKIRHEFYSIIYVESLVSPCLAEDKNTADLGINNTQLQ